MKILKANVLCATVLACGLVASSVYGANITKTNNLDNLDLGTSWVGGVAPGTGDTAVFDSTYANPGTLNVGALVQWSGLRVTSPGGAVLINNSTSPNNVGIGAGGVDLSAATTNLVIRRFEMDAGQTWNIASGSSFRIGSPNATFAPAANNAANNRVGVFVNNAAGATITLAGAGIAYLDMGNASLGSVNWQINGGTLAAIWNQANAFGSGAITLAGGGLADGTPIAGSLGNWTWNNAITLQASTTSFIDNQNTGGSGRWLKLESAFAGSGNLEFRDTGVSFNNPDFGFILAGPSTMTGTVTITPAAEVRVGGSAPGGLNANPGSSGDFGSVTGITNNGVLTFTRVDAYSPPCVISGTGTLRIGGTSGTVVGDAYQVITLNGANTYSGPTIINGGTLTLAAGATLPNTPSISITTNSVNGGAVINTLDVSALTGGFTTAAGQTLNLNGGAVTGTLNLGVGSTNIFAPGGSGVVGNLNITGDLNLSGGTNTFVLDINNTPANDTVTVNGALTASGVTTLQFVPPVGGLNAGTYTLITSSGALTATPANFAITGLIAGPRPQTFSIQISGNSVQLVVVGSPGNLTWVGDGVNNVWDVATTTNWFNTLTSLNDVFYQNDQVTFDDSGSATPAIKLTGALTPSSITVSANSKNYTFGGSGQLAGSGTLTVNGISTLTMLTSNTFTGNLSVSGGVLAITNEMALNQPTNPVSQSLTLDNGGALLVTNNVTIGANTNRGIIIGTAGGTLSASSGATLTVSSVIGDLTGVSVLTKTGNGTLVLAGNNNYGNGGSVVDATVINGGTVIYGSGAGLSRGATTLGNSGFFAIPFELDSGVVDLNGMISYQPNFPAVTNGTAQSGTGVILYNNTINVNGLAGVPLTIQDTGATPSGFGSTAATVLNYNGISGPGTLTINARFAVAGTSSTSTRTFSVDDSPATTTEVNITAPMGVTVNNSTNQDGRNVTIIKSGSGTMQISATNNFPVMEVDAGTLRVNNPQALGADRSGANAISGGTGTPNLVIVTAGILDLNGFSPAIGGLSDNAATTGVITNNGATLSTLTLGNSLNGTVYNASYSSVIANGAQAISLVKTGTNTQVLAGINTYSGSTTVGNGALLVNAPGQIAGSGVTVTGGVLGGSGTIAAPTVIQATGTLAPGAGAASPVTLTFNGNLTLGGTNVMNVNKDTATNDLIVLTAGTVSYGGVLVVSTNQMVSTTLALGDSFKLFNAPAATGNFSGIAGSPGAGLAWSFNPTTGVLSVVNSAISPVPIVSSYAGGVLSLSWPSGQGWVLQWQTNALSTGLSTNWTSLTDGSVNSTNITVDPTRPTVFYRLSHP